MKALKLVISIAIVAAAALALRSVAYMPVHCNNVASSIENNLTSMEHWADPARIFPATRSNLQRLAPCTSELPWDTRLQVLVAANYAARGEDEKALQLYREALRRDRRSEIYFDVGVELVRLNRIDEAMEPLLVGCIYARPRMTVLPQPLQERLQSLLPKD